MLHHSNKTKRCGFEENIRFFSDYLPASYEAFSAFLHVQMGIETESLKAAVRAKAGLVVNKALRSLCGVTKGLKINKVFCAVRSFITIPLFLRSVLIHRAAATKLFK